MSNNINKFVSTNMSGEQTDTYICDTCFHTVNISYRSIPSLLVKSNSDDITIDGLDVNIAVHCKSCDGYMFKCDPKLVERMINLNKLELSTAHCCEGHVRNMIYSNSDENIGQLIEMPYISFYKCLDDREMSIIESLVLDDEYRKYIRLEDGNEYLTLRGMIFGAAGMAIYKHSSQGHIDNMIEYFNTIQSKFMKFVDDLIRSISQDK